MQIVHVLIGGYAAPVRVALYDGILDHQRTGSWDGCADYTKRLLRNQCLVEADLKPKDIAADGEITAIQPWNTEMLVSESKR